MNHNITINGTPLTFVEYVTLLTALRTFSNQLHTVGLGEDETSKSATKTHISSIGSLGDLLTREKA